MENIKELIGRFFIGVFLPGVLIIILQSIFHNLRNDLIGDKKNILYNDETGEQIVDTGYR
jgi:hypothetical protein